MSKNITINHNLFKKSNTESYTLNSLTDSFIQLMEKRFLQKVLDVSSQYVGQHNIVYDLVKRLIPNGKKLRSRMMLGMHITTGHPVTNDDIVMAGVVESLHAASLLHDDVIDESTQRHHMQSANSYAGNRMAILSGDFLMVLSIFSTLSVNNIPVQDVLMVMQDLLGGEMLGYEVEHEDKPSMVTYERLIQLKTSSLFAMAITFGLRAQNNIDIQHTDYDSLHQRMVKFSNAFGYLYQVQDDVRDYFYEQDLGKDVGQDFLEGKWTYPVLCLWDQLNLSEKNHWLTLKKQKDFTQACKFLHDHQAKDQSLEHLKRKKEQLKLFITKNMDHPYDQFLNMLVRDYIVLV